METSNPVDGITTDHICKCIMPTIGSNSPDTCRTCGNSLLFRSGKISIITWYTKEYVLTSFEGTYIIDTVDGETKSAYFEINAQYKGFFKHQHGDNIDKNVVYWSYLPESQAININDIQK